MTSLAVTNSFASGGTIQSAQVNTNFDDVESVVNGGIDDSNISASAGIAVQKLAAPYSPGPLAQWFSGPTTFTVPALITSVFKTRLSLPQGRPHFITFVDVWCTTLTASTRFDVSVLLETVALGGAPVQITLQDTHVTSDLTNLPFAVANGDELIIRWQAITGTPQVTNATVTVYGKVMHAS